MNYNAIFSAPPLPPFLQLTLFPDGNTLQARWNRPFTMAGFPITSYTLDVVNKTDGETTRVILDQDLAQTMTYNLTRSRLHISCHSLEFSAIASNLVGDSTISNSLISGFPICMYTRCLKFKFRRYFCYCSSTNRKC